MTATITERQKTEYDRFGPWTYRVSTPDEMPERFDPWYEGLKDSVLILKLPKSVERRNVKPGSDLYEGILAVGKEGIVYITVKGEETIRRVAVIGEITALRRSLDLLHGEISIDRADGTSLTIGFNAVSDDVFDDFIEVVRRVTDEKAVHGVFAPAERGKGPTEEDMLSLNLLRVMRRRFPGLALLAYQAPCILAKAERSSGLASIAHAILRWRLDGCLVTATPTQLILLYKGTGSPRLGKFRGFRHETIYIPAASFKNAAVEERTLLGGAVVHVFKVFCLGHEYELLFADPPTEAVSALGRR